MTAHLVLTGWAKGLKPLEAYLAEIGVSAATPVSSARTRAAVAHATRVQWLEVAERFNMKIRTREQQPEA